MTATRRSPARFELEFVEPPPPFRALRAVDKKPAGTRRVITPRDYVAPDSHRAHGTRVKYVIERCRCEPCRIANRAAEQQRRRAIQRPDETWVPYVPAGPARRHVRELMAFGIGPKHLAVISGVPHGAISKLIYGDYARGMEPSKRIRPQTARRLLAIQPVIDNLGPRQPIDGAPYRAMIDDLVARGFTKTWIAQRIHHPGAKAIQIGGRGSRRHEGTIGAGVAVRIRDLYRSLDGQRGPGRRNPWDTIRARSAP